MSQQKVQTAVSAVRKNWMYLLELRELEEQTVPVCNNWMYQLVHRGFEKLVKLAVPAWKVLNHYRLLSYFAPFRRCCLSSC